MSFEEKKQDPSANWSNNYEDPDEFSNDDLDGDEEVDDDDDFQKLDDEEETDADSNDEEEEEDDGYGKW